MEISHYDYKDLPYINPSDLAYIKQEDRLRPFYKYDPIISSFGQVIQDKMVQPIDRPLLVNVLTNQYENVTTDSSHAQQQINKLLDKQTFTVTTAHQPVLFTGPLYVVYKIISTIKLSRDLNNAYPDHHFIPTFITGGEDHDFDEMNHLRLFGKEIVWKNDQQGAVGRMSTESLKDVLSELQAILGDSTEARSIFELIYSTHQHTKYADAYIDLINGLFGKFGLLILNMDHPDLKRKMEPIFRSELLDHEGSEIVRKTQAQIVAAGLGEQAFVRDINLFYLGTGDRARIEKNLDKYIIVDTEVEFTESEILDELAAHPGRFSPNVITRPLYQESILPNLAYIGGGGEIAYWLERKAQFEHFGVNFPMLIRRDSCLWIESSVRKRMDKLETTLKEFFVEDEAVMVKSFLEKAAENEFKLGKEKGQLIQLFKEIEQKAVLIDPTLRKTVAAEGRNQVKALENIESKLRKAEKQRHEISIRQLKSVREKIFPGRSLQERKDNFLNFYTLHSSEYFEVLLEAFDPLDQRFIVIEANP